MLNHDYRTIDEKFDNNFLASELRIEYKLAD